MSLVNTVSYLWNHPIASRERIATFRRVLHWQITSRLTGEKIVYPWIESSSFIVGRGEAGLTANIYTGLHEFDEMSFALHVLRREDLFFDVGANLGEYTILACAVVGAEGICFEPVPSTFRRLEQNLAVNNLGQRVRSVNCAAGSNDGSILFTTNLDTTNHVVLGERVDSNTIEVPLRTLDSFCVDRVPFLMKIDVEGFEMSVLKGASTLLNDHRLQAIIIEMNGAGVQFGYTDSEIHEKLETHGFMHVNYDACRRSLSVPVRGEHSGENRIYVRDLAKVADRVASARKFQIGTVLV